MGGLACATCGTENPEQARFCMSCGNALERRCPSCNEPAPPEARFCMSCGASLGGPAPAPAGTPGPAGLPEERRQVTVLFADLSGYTAVAERMDPEAVKTLVERALRRLGDEVGRYGGTVDKYIGDNVMALFGAPVAHEDDAERAVRAALGMQGAMGEINDALPEGISFALRVGINTGEVLAGAVGDGYTVVGDTVNVASRLQSAGSPGAITVGERTFRATVDAIHYEELEPLDLKGKAEPVPAWRAVGLKSAHALGRIAAKREAPLVGRDYEVGTLASLHERVVREGRPHLVTLVGEAGVGKSRLLREFERHVILRAATLRTGRCLPYGSGPRLLGAGRGDPRGVRGGGRRLLGGGLGQARLLRRGAAGRHRRGGDRARRAQGGADRPVDRPRAARRAAAPVCRRPRAAARGIPLRAAGRRGGDGPPPPAGAGLRGHPLGRRRHARRDRAPRAVGPGAADAALPRARRAARAAHQLGWRPAKRHAAVPRAADPAGHPGARLLAAQRGPPRPRAPAGGGRAIRRQPVLRRGDGPARGGGRPDRPRGAAGQRPGRAGRAARRPRAVRAAPRAAGGGRRPDLLGELAGHPGPAGEPRPRGRADRAAGEGHPRPGRRGPPARGARAGLQARPDPRRGVQDAAQGGAIAEALRGRPLHRGARRRPHRRGGGAAGGALRPRGFAGA